MRAAILPLAFALGACASASAPDTSLFQLEHKWEGPIPDMRIVWTVTDNPCAVAAERKIDRVSEQCNSATRRPVALAIIEGPGVCHIVAPVPRAASDAFRVDTLRHELAHCIPGNFDWHAQ